MIFLLKCPKCKSNMKYQSKNRIVSANRKQCVYCGRSFKIGRCILKELK